MEYYAIRHSAGMLDVSPLYKYLIRGKDALSLVNKVVTRNAKRLAKGQIYYTPWCDERGKTVDDGTLWNFGDGSFRMTSAEPNLKWLQDAGMGLDAEVVDVSEDIGALAVQGPSSRAILMEGADGAVQKLKYFRFVNTAFAGIPVQISRTGYTGDLGYEIWVERERAEALWDALMDKGRGHDITPAGMLALDVARIEAGLILAEVEYMPARKAVIDVQRYSPYELSLDWTVASEKGSFIGRRALLDEKRRGPARRTVGLVIDWRTVEQLYLNMGLPPQPPSAPWRAKIPLHAGYRQIGWATRGDPRDRQEGEHSSYAPYVQGCLEGPPSYERQDDEDCRNDKPDGHQAGIQSPPRNEWFLRRRLREIPTEIPRERVTFQ